MIKNIKLRKSNMNIVIDILYMNWIYSALDINHHGLFNRNVKLTIIGVDEL